MSAVRSSPPLPLVERWLEYLADIGRSPVTIASYHAALLDFCRRIDTDSPERATIRELDRYRFRLGLAGLSANTKRIRLTALVSFFRFLRSRGHIETNPTADLEIPNPRDFNFIPTFTGLEIERLVYHYDGAPLKGRREPRAFFDHRAAATLLAEARDPGLISLVYACGLRVSEVSLLERDDYDGRTVYIRGGKAAKSIQRVAVFRRAQIEMQLYLDALDISPWREHPALFPPLYESPKRLHRGFGLSADAVAYILASRIARAGIDPKRRRLSPHALRYSIATHLYEHGYPELEIKRHLRHADLGPLHRYVNLGAFGVPKLREKRLHPWALGRAFVSAAD